MKAYSQSMVLDRISSSPLFEDYAVGPSPTNPAYGSIKYRIPGGEYISVKFVRVNPQWLEILGIMKIGIDKPEVGEDGYYVPSNKHIATEQLIRRFGIKEWREVQLEFDYG